MALKRIIQFSLLALLFIFSVSACKPKEKKTNWNVSYSSDAKDPYAFSLYKASMSKLFPNAKISSIPVSSTIFSNPYTKERSAYFILANEVDFNEQELWDLERWLTEGNDVVINAYTFGTKLSEYLYFGQTYWNQDVSLSLPYKTLEDTTGANVSAIVNINYGATEHKYNFNVYKYDVFGIGFKILNTPQKSDTFNKAVHVISQIENGLPNAVVFQIGEGRIILMSSPLAFANYNLLQQNNINYLADVMSYVNKYVKKLYLAEGYRKEADHSNLSVILKHKATKTAIILALIGILVYVLTNLRRKQNIIPIVKPLTNDSKSFVETIASLYYNKRNNRNIAQKMIQHFLEHVRTHYKLNTSSLNQEFGQKLSMRSGVSIDTTQALLYQIMSIQNDTVIVDDKYLHSLYVNIQKFLKK